MNLIVFKLYFKIYIYTYRQFDIDKALRMSYLIGGKLRDTFLRKFIKVGGLCVCYFLCIRI